MPKPAKPAPSGLTAEQEKSIRDAMQRLGKVKKPSSQGLLEFKDLLNLQSAIGSHTGRIISDKLE